MVSRSLFQPRFNLLMFPEVRAHHTFPKIAMVRHRKMQKFMDDHVVSEIAPHPQQFVVETECS